MSTPQPMRNIGGTDPYQEVQAGAEFSDLRKRFRGFVFPMTALFLAWYFLYVVTAAFAPGFMATKVFGTITIGLLFGLAQFASTFAITMIYARWADTNLDPTAAHLRDVIEGGDQ